MSGRALACAGGLLLACAGGAAGTTTLDYPARCRYAGAAHRLHDAGRCAGNRGVGMNAADGPAFARYLMRFPDGSLIAVHIGEDGRATVNDIRAHTLPAAPGMVKLQTVGGERYEFTAGREP